MKESSPLPDITDDEVVARYIFFRSHIRQSDQTVKPDAFIPHPHLDLSVTRHLGIDETFLWRIGQEIAGARTRSGESPLILHGRADIVVRAITEQNLQTQAQPTAQNPNHANIVGWPTDKAAQKMKAQLLAMRALYTAKPDSF